MSIYTSGEKEVRKKGEGYEGNGYEERGEKRKVSTM